jgi:hypothetical protein
MSVVDQQMDNPGFNFGRRFEYELTNVLLLQVVI